MVNESALILQRLITSNAPTAVPTATYQLEQHVNQAMTLLETYIDARSPYELNLSAEIRRNTRRVVAAIESHVMATLNPNHVVASVLRPPHNDHPNSSTTVVSSKYQVAPTTSSSPSPDDIVFTGDALLPGGDAAKYHQLLLKLATLFDEVSASCIHLLQRNSFTRFRSSTLYRDFVSELEKGNTAKVAMKKAGSRLRLTMMSQGGGHGTGNNNEDGGSIISVNGHRPTPPLVGTVVRGGLIVNNNNTSGGSISGGLPLTIAMTSTTNNSLFAGAIGMLASPLPPPSTLTTMTSMSPTGGMTKRASYVFPPPVITGPLSSSTLPTMTSMSSTSPTAHTGRVSAASMRMSQSPMMITAMSMPGSAVAPTVTASSSPATGPTTSASKDSLQAISTPTLGPSSMTTSSTPSPSSGVVLRASATMALPSSSSTITTSAPSPNSVRSNMTTVANGVGMGQKARSRAHLLSMPGAVDSP
jgi:hypothetical protein